jgi:hypothetical protein
MKEYAAKLIRPFANIPIAKVNTKIPKWRIKRFMRTDYH